MRTQNGMQIIDVRKLLFGWLIAMVALITGAGLVAMLIGNNIVEEPWLDYGTVLIILLSSFIGSVVSVLGVKSKRLITSGIFALVFWISLLGLTALFFGGRYNGVTVTLLVVLAGSALPVLLGGKGKKKHIHYPSHR